MWSRHIQGAGLSVCEMRNAMKINPGTSVTNPTCTVAPLQLVDTLSSKLKSRQALDVFGHNPASFYVPAVVWYSSRMMAGDPKL